MGLFWNKSALLISSGSEWSERRVSMLLISETWPNTLSLLLAVEVPETLSVTSVITYF